LLFPHVYSPVRVFVSLFCFAANNVKMPQSAFGSWGDAIKKNALGAGVVPVKKPITKKAW